MIHKKPFNSSTKKTYPFQNTCEGGRQRPKNPATSIPPSPDPPLCSTIHQSHHPQLHRITLSGPILCIEVIEAAAETGVESSGIPQRQRQQSSRRWFGELLVVYILGDDRTHGPTAREERSGLGRAVELELIVRCDVASSVEGVV